MPIDTTQPYDSTNVFARILRGELPCNQVYADEWALAFHDIRPQAPVHVLVIPRGPWVSWDDSPPAPPPRKSPASSAPSAKSPACWNSTRPGYRLLVNMGQHGHQEVAHLHVHIFGGRQFFHMVAD